MGLVDSLRRAEEQGRAATRRGWERAREGWEDAERAIRRKMRIHPPRRAQEDVAPVGPVVSEETQQESRREPANENVEPIVSVHGRDISRERKAA